ncbi:MAG: bifunctional glutamate N-acetyltransferase/amino-acid acetyltransferase ArgJ [Pseudomonadota bacterium]
MAKDEKKKKAAKKDKAGSAKAGLAAKMERKLAKLQKRSAKLNGKLGEVGAEIAALSGGHVSPFATPFPDMPEVKGVRLAATAAGVKYEGRADVMLAEIAAGSTLAGVLTKSATRSGPVDWCRKLLTTFAKTSPKDKAKPPSTGKIGIVVNSGNANAFTGDHGMKGVEATAKAAAKAIGGAASRVFIASTGVIGEPLPAEKITAKLDGLAKDLSPDAMQAAAEAIMTTDTFPKGAYRQVELDGETVTIAGFAKGSGMIAPDMATMLGFVFTDAGVSQRLLQSMLSTGTEVSFNSATVDSDTSTSDTVLLAATGQATAKPIATRRDPRAAAFEAALREVLVELAQLIVRDGEGISKFVSIKVEGAKSDASAGIIARAIANSPLVKTAIAGEDPNWGRVVMAVGKSGQPADRDRLSIRFGDVLVAENGWVAESYSEEAGAAVMKGDEIEIGVDLGLGSGSAEVWTCDLTHQYITINADYRS